jgi:4a-hydroxytetrahydrobiopterin dehydratase
LVNLHGWKVENKILLKDFEFSNFAESLAFVNKVGAIAEELDHHPDITFGWGYAGFAITTHDTGGLTHNDFDLAKRIENL